MNEVIQSRAKCKKNWESLNIVFHVFLFLTVCKLLFRNRPLIMPLLCSFVRWTSRNSKHCQKTKSTGLVSRFCMDTPSHSSYKLSIPALKKYCNLVGRVLLQELPPANYRRWAPNVVHLKKSWNSRETSQKMGCKPKHNRKTNVECIRKNALKSFVISTRIGLKDRGIYGTSGQTHLQRHLFAHEKSSHHQSNRQRTNNSACRCTNRSRLTELFRFDVYAKCLSEKIPKSHGGQWRSCLIRARQR